MTAPALDRRVNAYRDDLAAESLRGRVEAPRFAMGEQMRVAVPSCPLLEAPDPESRLGSELLFGESLRCYDRHGAWAWVQNDADGYVGYLPAEVLQERTDAPTHWVQALRTPLFSGPDLKRPILGYLSMGALVTPLETAGDFLRIAEGAWIYAAHLGPRESTLPDWTATALRFVGTPYVWGGRTSLGLDCSALIQIALWLAGRDCPRDSDLQADCDSLGERLEPDVPLRRGDIVFWRGHVAIALDSDSVVNATAAGLTTRVEPRAAIDARARAESGHGITAIRRP
jgi:hypothetical protein